jgi:hypothetical protein
MPTTTSTRKRPRGRPTRGILDTYQQISFYLKPALVQALDRAADREEARTGEHVNRVTLIRRAIVQYLRTLEQA